MKSIVNMAELVRIAKKQTDDIPAPRVKVHVDIVPNISSRSTTFSNFNYDMADVSEMKLANVEFKERVAHSKDEIVDTKADLKQLRHEERKLVKKIYPSNYDNAIKNTKSYVHKKERQAGPLIKKEMILLQKEKKGPVKHETKSIKPVSTTARGFSRSIAAPVNARKTVASTTIGHSSTTTAGLAELTLSEQTLEDDIKKSKKELDKYRKMVNPSKIKRYSKPPIKLPILEFWKDLHNWDISSNAKRDTLVFKFIHDYTSIEPLDLDNLLSHGTSLIFIRFVVTMQLAFERRKPIWHYVQALGIFIKSLQGERFTTEFCLMGGFATAFSALKIDEMKIRDKANVLYFLYRTIEVPGGTRVKNFICRESTYLDSVVDCLTMCNNIGIVHFAQLFLETMCIGTKPENLALVANYIISLLPCDFNSRVQVMACEILKKIIHQQSEIAQRSYEYVVDVLKTDYDPLLVPVAELCISIMETPSADHLMQKLVEVAQPMYLTDDLAIIIDLDPDNANLVEENIAAIPNNKKKSSQFEPELLEMVQQQQYDDEFEEDSEITAGGLEEEDLLGVGNESDGNGNGTAGAGETSEGAAAAALTGDMFYRQQLGSLFVLGFILKSRADFAQWMIQKGVIGSLLSAIGTPTYYQIQLRGIRLLLLLHESSSDCAAALIYLLPKKLVTLILEKGENSLEYITAVHCVVLRKLGRLVQQYWQQWFTRVVLPPSRSEEVEAESKVARPSSPVLDEEEKRRSHAHKRQSRSSGEATERPLEEVLHEIRKHTEKLEELIGDTLENVLATMDIMLPEASFFGKSTPSDEIPVRLAGKASDELTLGEHEILRRESLEPFRKYLDQSEGKPVDEFEKYYAAQFRTEEEEEYEMAGALQDAEKALGHLTLSGGGASRVEEMGEVEVSSDNDLSGASMHSTPSSGTVDTNNEEID